jgi:hypothetical protein
MQVHNLKRNTGTGNLFVEEYESLGDALRRAGANSDPKSSNRAGRGDWTGGTASLGDAVTLGLCGWREIRPDVDAAFADIAQQIADRVDYAMVAMASVAGGIVNVPSYLGGDPECMIDFPPVEQSRMGRVVKVLVNMSASAHVAAEDMKRRGIMTVCLVDALHKLGVGVEVWAEMPYAYKGVDKGDVYSQLVRIHDSSEMLDIDNLMFAICHPSMLRRIGFSLMEQSAWKHAGSVVGHGYGYPSKTECGARIGADVVIEKVQSASGNWRKNAMEWVMSTVRGLGLIE